MKSVFLLAAISGLLFTATPNARASAEDHVDQALAISKTWVGQIDAGEYDESYAFGCSEMHDKVKQDRWQLILKALRTPWGPVVSRQQINHIYKPDGFEGTEGEFLVITYDTTFEKLPAATEIVVLKWEDGEWRGAGYNATAKPSPDAPPDTATQSATEVHTEEHVQPPPQQQAN